MRIDAKAVNTCIANSGVKTFERMKDTGLQIVASPNVADASVDPSFFIGIQISLNTLKLFNNMLNLTNSLLRMLNTLRKIIAKPLLKIGRKLNYLRIGQ